MPVRSDYKIGVLKIGVCPRYAQIIRKHYKKFNINIEIELVELENIRKYIKNNQYDISLIHELEIIRKERIKFFWGKESLNNITHFKMDWIDSEEFEALSLNQAKQKLNQELTKNKIRVKLGEFYRPIIVAPFKFSESQLDNYQRKVIIYHLLDARPALVS